MHPPMHPGASPDTPRYTAPACLRLPQHPCLQQRITFCCNLPRLSPSPFHTTPHPTAQVLSPTNACPASPLLPCPALALPRRRAHRRGCLCVLGSAGRSCGPPSGLAQAVELEPRRDPVPARAGGHAPHSPADGGALAAAHEPRTRRRRHGVRGAADDAAAAAGRSVGHRRMEQRRRVAAAARAGGAGGCGGRRRATGDAGAAGGAAADSDAGRHLPGHRAEP